MKRLGIGRLSQHTGCNIETIRYYERIGLLPAPPRSRGGHRSYSDEHTKRLTFIRRSRELGFTLKEVRGLLELVDGDGDGHTCEAVQAITVKHAAEIREKIADLRKLERVLEDMAEQCPGGKVPECPIIDALFDETKT